MEVPSSGARVSPLLIWSPRFRHRVSSRSAAVEKTAARTHPSARGTSESRFSAECKGASRTEIERGKSREGGTRYPRDAKRQGGKREGEREKEEERERIGGGLKGSERLDKSNPLKVRPTLCLPMRLRISRLHVPDSLKGARLSRGRKREKPWYRGDTENGENEARTCAHNKTTHCIKINWSSQICAHLTR